MLRMMQSGLWFSFCLTLVVHVYSATDGTGCQMLNDCNGHGSCNQATKVCTCYDGFGSPTDVAEYKAPDCSLRVCPAAPAWADVASAATTAHAKKECSGAGLCDRATGKCTCFPSYTGAACDRKKCPNDCSGHGRCLSMRKLATLTSALPLSAATTYTGLETTTTWDQDREFACLCDSSWTVGLASGETQVPEWFGADCSKRNCPSGNDPMTSADETSCSGTAATGGVGTGATGNLCHAGCGNRGICDYSQGLCTCFNGFYGGNCISKSQV